MVASGSSVGVGGGKQDSLSLINVLLLFFLSGA